MACRGEQPLQEADQKDRWNEVVIDRRASRRVERIRPPEREIEDERHRDRGDEDVHGGPPVAKKEVEDGGQLAPPQTERRSEQGDGRRTFVRGNVADQGPRDERDRGREENQSEGSRQAVCAGHVAAVEPCRGQRGRGEPERELIPSRELAGLCRDLVGRLVLGGDHVEAPENFHERDASRRAILGF